VVDEKTVTRDEQIAEYLAHGWKLCDIAPGGKGPRTVGWNLPGHELTAPPPVGHGLGLLHAYSGTCCLDVDQYPALAARLKEHGIDLDELLNADDAVRISSGRPDSAKLLYALTVPRASVQIRAGDKVIGELRCASANGNSLQDVLPPSMHPRGTPYTWIFGMLSPGWQALPPLPAALEALWDELKAPAPTVAAGPPIAPPPAPRQADLDRFLAAEDPNGSFEDWLRVGMVIHHEYNGDPAARSVWDEWSVKSHKYQGTADLDTHWRTFRVDKPGRTLDGWLQKQPAESMPPAAPPQEFTTPDKTKPRVDTFIESNPATETVPERAVRELLEHRVVHLPRDNAFYLRADPARPHSLDTLSDLAIVKHGFRDAMSPFMPQKLKNKGGDREPMDAAAEFLMAPYYLAARGMGFCPDPRVKQERGCYEWHGHRYVNLYTDPNITAIRPTKEQIEPLLFLLRRIQEKAARDWIVWLFSFKCHNPGERVIGAPLLFSEMNGTGKTTLMKTLPQRLFSPQYVYEIPKTELDSNFATQNFGQYWWISLEEIRASGGKLDKKFITDIMKTWITSETVSVSRKFMQPYAIQNHLQFTATTQHADAIHIEDGDSERRWCIGSMCEQMLTEREKAYLDPLFGATPDPRAGGWLRWWFLNEADPGVFKPNSPPPTTDRRRDMAARSENDALQQARMLFDMGHAPFEKDIVTAADLRDQLRAGYKTPNWTDVADILRKLGGEKVGRTATDRMWIVRNHEFWREQSKAALVDHLRTGQRPAIDPMDGLL
jgi:hypothetical protein